MTDEQLNQLKRREVFRRSAHRMVREHAGSFAEAIAQAYFCADSKNASKLEEAFSDLFKRFMRTKELELFRESTLEVTQ
jgi:hypothetical protein